MYFKCPICKNKVETKLDSNGSIIFCRCPNCKYQSGDAVKDFLKDKYKKGGKK